MGDGYGGGWVPDSGAVKTIRDAGRELEGLLISSLTKVNFIPDTNPGSRLDNFDVNGMFVLYDACLAFTVLYDLARASGIKKTARSEELYFGAIRCLKTLREGFAFRISDSPKASP